MQQAVSLFQQALQVVCIIGLLISLAILLLAVASGQVSAVMRWARHHPFQSAFLLPCACVAVLYGGSKPDPVTPTVKGITIGSPCETPTQVELEWQPDAGTEIATNQRVRVYWRDSDSPIWQLACDGYGITNAVVSGFFINRDTDWQVVVDGTNTVQEVQP